jgi:hypothetical protein
MATTTAPIVQALVQKLRGNATLKAALRGGINEGVAPQKTARPFLIFSLHYAPVDYDFTSMTYEVGVDVFVIADNPVDARNIDALVFTTLQDSEATFAVTGQSTLICRRISEMTLADVSEEGRKIYQVGGVWEIWTNQPR